MYLKLSCMSVIPHQVTPSGLIHNEWKERVQTGDPSPTPENARSVTEAIYRLNIFLLVLVPGFEPGSKAREAFMMGHYTIRATGHRLVTRIYSERVVAIFTFTQK